MKKLFLLTKTLLVMALLCVGANAWAYDTPDGYKVGTVYVGTEVNNQVLAETFANCTLNTDLTSLSTNWSSNVGGTTGFFWAKIKNTVRTVAYPATNQATLYTCNKYTATNDGGTTNKTIYSDDGGSTYYTSNDLQSVFNATGYEVTADGTGYQIPSYVYGKCISLQHRTNNQNAFYLDYTLTSAISTGKLVFGADFYRIQTVELPLYIQFFDSSDNLVFQIYYKNGSGRQTMYYQVGTNAAVGGAGYSEYRIYHGWGIKDMVFDLDAGTVSYIVDNVHWDSQTSPNRRKVSQSAINFGTGKNIAKIRFSITPQGNSTRNHDLFVDNMYLYTLVSGSASTSDMTFVGSKDYEDDYLGSTSSDYVIKPNGKLHLKFKNYGSGAQSWNNWIALFNNADKSSNLAYVRSDAWEVVSGSNTGITTSGNYWDDFQTDMYGSDVVMDITRTDGNVNMLATITTTASEELTLTYNKAIGNAEEDIVFRLSEEGACLVLDNTKSALVAPPTFSQTGITNTGNPIITVTENTGDSPTAGSAIYYTTNGDTPTTSCTSYSAPVTVTGGNTIKAITVVTASDGTTTLTSSASSLVTTAYVNGQTYDFTVPTESDITAAGFGNRNGSVTYGLGSTSRYSYNVSSSGLTVMGGVTLQGDGDGTYWYWMTGQGLWQADGNRSVTVNNTKEGEVALFTRYDCRHDGSNWSLNEESDYYESDCSYKLSKSNNSTGDGHHVYMVKKVQTFVPAGTTVSKTISSAGWSTYCSPYALDFSSSIANLEGAYIITGNSGNTLTLSDAITTTVPANTGLLLKGTASTAVTIPVAATGSYDTSGNKLVGVTTSGTKLAAEGGYVLMTDPELGFYKNNNEFTLSANSAYLPTANVSAARSAYFFGGITGVEAVEAKAEAAEKDGKFVINGQLVIKKNGKMFNANGAQMK